MTNEWIEWKGGECPVEKGTLIDIKYRDQLVIKGRTPPPDWAHDDHPGDIVAYRPCCYQPKLKTPHEEALEAKRVQNGIINDLIESIAKEPKKPVYPQSPTKGWTKSQKRISRLLTPTQLVGYQIGTIHTHLSKVKRKDDITHLKMAKLHLDWLIERLESEQSVF